MDRVDDGGAGGVQIDDRPVAHPAGDLMTDAEDARVIVGDAGDETTNLRRADIDGGDQTSTRSDRWSARLCPSAPARRWSEPIPFAYRRFVHCAHVFFAGERAFFETGVSLGVSGLTRSTSRSGSRISMVCTSRWTRALDRSRRASCAHASAVSSAGGGPTTPRAARGSPTLSTAR